MRWRPTGLGALGMLPETAWPWARSLRGRGPAAAGIPDDVQVRARDSDLVFVLSLPRSGTNAFGGLLRTGFPSLVWEGELFYGHLRGPSAAALAEPFPWALAFRGGGRERPNAPQRRALHRDYRVRMDRAAPEVLARLLQGRTGPTVVKVFPIHLHRSSVARLLAEFRPRVIDHRRRLLFSYVSLMKAQSTGVWGRQAAPEQEVRWRERQVRRYIARCDEWTRWYVGLVHDLGLETVRLSYEGLYETRSDLAVLRGFFPEAPVSAVGRDDDLWMPPTVIQDRRSDGALANLLTGFESLSDGTQSDLLRYPGD